MPDQTTPEATRTIGDYTHAEWLAEAKRRFGDDPTAWRFQCPACGHVATPGDFKAAGAEGPRAAQECLGRVLPRDESRSALQDRGDGPCDWAAFGLFDICTVHVDRDGKRVPVFAFAEDDRG